MPLTFSAPSKQTSSTGALQFTTPAPAQPAAPGLTPLPSTTGDTGGSFLGNLAYGAAKGITQTIDKPFLALMGVPRLVADTLTNGGQAPALPASGYSYGDFLGSSQPLGHGMQAIQTTQTSASAAGRLIADNAGLTFGGGASIALAPEEEAVGAVEGAVGLSEAAAKSSGVIKSALTSPIGKFSAGQGAIAGLNSYGQGNSATGAATTAVESGLASAATLKLFDVAGSAIKSSAFMGSAMNTKVGQAFTTVMQGVGKTIQGMSDALKETTGDVTDRYRAQYQSQQSDIANAKMQFLGGIKSQIDTSMPDQKTWVGSLMDAIHTGIRGLNDAKEAVYGDVYNSGATLTGSFPKLSAGIKDMESQLSDVAGNANDPFPNIKDPETKAQLMADMAAHPGASTSSIAPELKNFMSELKSRILTPAEKGSGVPIKEINNFKNFIEAKGTSAEKAMASKLSGLAHQDMEDSLGTMGAQGKKLLTALNDAKDKTRNITKLKESAFVKYFDTLKNPGTLGEDFLNGKIFKDKSEIDDLGHLFGSQTPVVIGQLRSQIMHTAVSNAISAFRDLTSTSMPEEFSAAESKASAEIQKFMDVAEGKMQLKPGGFQAISAQQRQWMADAQHFISNFNMKNIGEKYGLPNPDAVAESAKNVESAAGKSAYAAAGTSPAKLATTISHMTSIDDVKSAMSFLKTPEDKAALGAQVLKNFVNGMGKAFKSSFTADDFTSMRDDLLNMGGKDKESVFNEIFGEGTATHDLVKSLNDSANAFEAFASEKTPSSLKALGDATAGVLFYAAGHPIMASGFAAKAIRGITESAEGNVFEDLTGKSRQDLVDMMTKNGEIDLSLVRKAWKEFGSILKGRVVKAIAGGTAAQGTGDIVTPEPDNQ